MGRKVTSTAGGMSLLCVRGSSRGAGCGRAGSFAISPAPSRSFGSVCSRGAGAGLVAAPGEFTTGLAAQAPVRTESSAMPVQRTIEVIFSTTPVPALYHGTRRRGVGPALLLLEGHVFVGGRPGIRVDLQQGRLGHPRADAARPDVLPDRPEPHPLVQELLDLVEHRLALLAIRLAGLLLEQVVDIGIGTAREVAVARHELGHARGGVAVGR